jgi:DNA invertase Pin-like site-specific DNA recombinase
MSSPSPERRLPTVASLKIGPRHLDRLAVVYVRQSTQQQVLPHQESTRLQYNLVERAVALGWSRERVLVIDDDLGRSGSNAEGRPGFQRLVAEVGLDHVGLILGLEMSRLARSCRDWHQLLEVCGLFHTLLSDPDGVYDPAHDNDRLLLGLKGTISEAELHVIKQRRQAGKLAKAQRGELGMQTPIGYVRRPSGEIVKDPDEQAQLVVQTVFEPFLLRGTIHGVLCHLVAHGIQMPVRVRSGPAKGDLSWARPNRMTLQNLFANPMYAGAYVYGKRPTDPRAKRPGRPATGRKVAHVDDLQGCLRDRLPAYLSWEQFERNQEQLRRNRNVVQGVPRQGVALLAGMLRCGRCGQRMVAQYSSGRPRYACVAEMTVDGGSLCQSLKASVLDEVVEAWLLRALEPAALEASLAAASMVEQQRAREEQLWQQRLERARYESERARRQYDLVEPENRLVARTLERGLEEKLNAEQRLQEEHRRYQAARPSPLTADERASLRQLGSELPALWKNPTTTSPQRKELARQLITEVRATVQGESERVDVVVQWAGGHETTTWTTRPVAKLSQLSYYGDLVARVAQLVEQGQLLCEMAETLNTEGWRPAKRRATFNASMVGGLLASVAERAGRRREVPDGLAASEWTLPGLAEHLAMSSITLHSWVRRGWVKARKIAVGAKRQAWALWADEAEVERLRQWKKRPRTRWPRAEG